MSKRIPGDRPNPMTGEEKLQADRFMVKNYIGKNKPSVDVKNKY